MKRNNLHPRIVLYLGAGASQFAGYFTFASFPELLFNDNLRRNAKMPELSSEPKQILTEIRRSLQNNSIPTTHDNFLWRLDGYTQLLRLNQRDDVLKQYLKDHNKLWQLSTSTGQAIDQITTTTIHHYSANLVSNMKESNIVKYQNLSRIFYLYHAMAGLNVDDQALPIFTTNYDMLIEDLVEDFGKQANPALGVINGIPNLYEEEGKWTPYMYNCRPPQRCLHLYRLHGCVCWFYHDQGDSNIYFHRRDAVNREPVKLCAMYPGRETSRGMDPHGFAFRNFYHLLQVCELVVFIGFSFRDDDVMHLLLKVLSERRGKLKILTVDREANRSDIQKRLEDAAKRSTLPYRIPGDKEIESLYQSFGIKESDDMVILDTCRKLLGE